MWYSLSKLILSALIIVVVSEVTKRSAFMGAFLVSLPLVSYLVFIWVYVDTVNGRGGERPADMTPTQHAVDTISQLSWGTLVLVIPSLALFLALPLLLKKMSFAPSLALATLIMFACYGVTVAIVRQFSGQA